MQILLLVPLLVHAFAILPVLDYVETEQILEINYNILSQEWQNSFFLLTTKFAQFGLRQFVTSRRK